MKSLPHARAKRHSFFHIRRTDTFCLVTLSAIRHSQLNYLDMESDKFNDYIGKPFIAFSILSTLLVWCFFTYFLTAFVPTESMPWMYVLSGFTATPLAGVYCIASFMFWLVVKEQREAKLNA